VNIRLPFPHPGQQTVRRQAQRFNWLAAGRRWRKTTLGMAIVVERVLDGQRWIWGAPTYDQVRICWNEMKYACGPMANFTQSRMVAEFPTGGRVVFRSLDDPDNARGHTADGVVLDEAEKIKASAWYEVIRPMLMDTGGDAWLMGTPLGRNWFWKEHILATDREDSANWQIPTLGCAIVDDVQLVRKMHPLENPDIPWAEIVHLFETLPRRTFQQEILAQFLEGQGAVFRNIAACCTLQPSTPDEHEGHEIVMGVDWGKSNDYTVFCVGCRQCRQEVALDRFHGVSYRLARQRLAVLAGQWGVYDILAESNAMGQPVIDEMQYDGLPVRGFQTTAASKPPLIENLALTLEREEVHFIDDPVATAELEAYEMKTSANTGRPTFSAPEGVNDDTVIGRELMCNALQLRGSWMQLL
jgi:hypothetical protein